MTRLDLRDPASANIKILESQNPSNGIYNLSMSDSVFTNANPAGGLDGHIRLSGARNGMKAFNLTVREHEVFGGAVNRMQILVERPGVFDGACTEFCGLQHAWMRQRVTAAPRAEFEAWVAQQRQPAASTGSNRGASRSSSRTPASTATRSAAPAHGAGRA